MRRRLLLLYRIRSGFLREALLQRLQLRINLIHFFNLIIGGQCLLPFGKRPLKKFSGAVIAAFFEIDIPEVAQNRRIAALAVHRFFQVLLSFGEFVLLVVSPAKTIKKRSVIRILLNGLLNQGRCLVQSYALIRQHVSQVIEHRRIIRVHVQHFPELLFGLLKSFFWRS